MNDDRTDALLGEAIFAQKVFAHSASNIFQLYTTSPTHQENESEINFVFMHVALGHPYLILWIALPHIRYWICLIGN